MRSSWKLKDVARRCSERQKMCDWLNMTSSYKRKDFRGHDKLWPAGEIHLAWGQCATSAPGKERLAFTCWWQDRLLSYTSPGTRREVYLPNLPWGTGTRKYKHLPAEGRKASSLLRLRCYLCPGNRRDSSALWHLAPGENHLPWEKIVNFALGPWKEKRH